MLLVLAFAATLAPGVVGAQAPASHAVVVAIDDLHMDFRTTPRTRKLLQDLLKTAPPDATWALVTTGTSSLRIQPAIGLAGVQAAVTRVTGNGLKPREVINAFESASQAAEVRRRASVSDFSIADFVTWVARTPFEKLDVVLLTEGYDTRLVPAMPGIVRAATEAHARLAIVSVRDLIPGVEPPADVRPEDWDAHVQATRTSLVTLADQTGGTVVFSKDDLDALFAGLSRP